MYLSLLQISSVAITVFTSNSENVSMEMKTDILEDYNIANDMSE